MPTDERHIEKALDRANFPGPLVTSWVPSPLEARLVEGLGAPPLFARRDPVSLVNRTLDRYMWPDIRRSIEFTLGGSSVKSHDDFFKWIDRRAARQLGSNTRLVVGRELGCLETLRMAKKMNIPSIYHMPTAHHETVRRMVEQEEAVFPGVCGTTFDKAEFGNGHISHKSEELALSDTIICPSGFVRDSLSAAGIPTEKISMAIYGCEPAWLDLPRSRPSKTFLFVGNITARKGVHRLLKAWKALGAHRTHELLLVGSMHLSPSFLADHAGVYRHQPRVPRRELASAYLDAAALVLPALAEGFALVIPEAASCGTPVLASLNSGASGFFESKDEAFLYEAANDDALMAALDWALTKPDDLEEMGRRGRARAANWLWQNFEDVIIRQAEQSMSVAKC